MGPLGAINSRQELARCNLSIAKYPVPWLFTFSFPSSLPVLRTFIPLLSPPRSRLIFFSSETSILRPSFAVGAPSGKKSDNNPVLRWGKEKKRDEFVEQFFDGGGKRKNCEIWMELLQFSSPEHVSSFVDLHPISMSRRYSNVTKNVWKEGKEEGIRALRTFVPTTRTFSKFVYLKIMFRDLSPNRIVHNYCSKFVMESFSFIGNNFSKGNCEFDSYFILQKCSYK